MENLLSIRRKLVFLSYKTITASSGYITATCDYIIKSCGFIIRACGYRFFAIKKHFITWREKFPSDPKEFRLYKDNEKFLIYIIIIFKIQTKCWIYSDKEWDLTDGRGQIGMDLSVHWKDVNNRVYRIQTDTSVDLWRWNSLRQTIIA